MSELARHINASLDLKVTLEAIAEAVIALVPCPLVEIDLWDKKQQMLVIQAIRSTSEHSFPVGTAFPPGKGYTGWVVRQRKPLLVSDVDQRRDIRPDLLPGERPFKSYAGFPLLAGDELIGALVLVHDEAHAFDEEDVKLLDALAGQAAIAIQNARLYSELNRHHQEHAALSAVTAAINRPLALQDLLENALDSVLAVTHANGGVIRLLDPQTQDLVLATQRGISDTYVREAARFPISREIVGEVARTGQAVLCDDMWIDPRVSPEVLTLLQEVGHRSLAQAPVVSQEKVVGTLGVTAKAPGFFNQDDLRLLIAIGQQLGIAIERAQLFEEAHRQAHRLSVLNAVAAVVNQSLALEEILDQAIDKVIEVMGTEAGGIRLLNPETGVLPIVASRGLSPELIQSTSSQRLGEGIVGDVARSGKPQVIKDVCRDPRVVGPSVMVKEGFHTFAVVPLRAKEVIVGTLGVITHQVRDFTREDMELLTAIGDQIGVAVENARLYTDLARRARQLEAVHAVAEVVNRTKELDRILNEGLRQTLAVTGLEMGAIALTNLKDRTLSIQACLGMSKDFVSWLDEKLKTKPLQPDAWPRDLDFYFEELASVHPTLPRQVVEEGLRLYAEIPLFAEGELVGVLIAATRGAHSFTDEEKVLLHSVGHQLGTAIADARLRQEALHTERLAAVGRVATSVAHDLRSPLGGILRSAEFLARPEISPETRRKLGSAIVSLSRRLINTSQQILDYVQEEHIPLQMAPCRLPEFLEDVLTLLEVDFADRGIEVVKEYRYRGTIVMDANRITQVICNIAANARDAMPQGGRFIIQTRKSGNKVKMLFTDTGPGVPEHIRARIFDPLFSYGKHQGAGLGLAIARRIVEQHKGAIQLKSQEGQGATFIVTLPV